MNFLPPIGTDIIRGHAGFGGISANADGTLFASVDCDKNCVYIYNAADRTADAIVELLKYPRSTCFAHRDGADTLLICDCEYDRIVEVTARGVFMRYIELDSSPYGIAYCGVRDVIAISLRWAHTVVLLQYESGAVKPEVTIGSGTGGNADGQLYLPLGVTFTADGRYVLVADWSNHRVSKFSAGSGAFVAHMISKGIRFPTDALQCEDGSIVVACARRVMVVKKDGVTVQNIVASGGAFSPHSLSYSSSLNGVVVKCLDGSVFVLRDAWSHSLRGTWVHACVSKGYFDPSIVMTPP
jgi:hypothetical protein